jgi:hypothetical protein
MARWIAERRDVMRTVAHKMGYRAGMAGHLDGVPAELSAVFAEVEAGAPSVWIAGVCRDAAGVREAAGRLLPLYRDGGYLWLLYPKKSSRIATDITRDRGWEPVHEAGFLPVAQVAVDGDWSALRFRRREEIREITRRSPTGG